MNRCNEAAIGAVALNWCSAPRTLDINPLLEPMCQKRSFVAEHTSLPRTDRLAKTNTPGRTVAVLAGFLPLLRRGIRHHLSMSASGKLRCSIGPHAQRPVRAVFSEARRCQSSHAALAPRSAASPKGRMLHSAPMSAFLGEDKNVTKSNRVSPRVCGTRFFSACGRIVANDKNDRFGDQM